GHARARAHALRCRVPRARGPQHSALFGTGVSGAPRRARRLGSSLRPGHASGWRAIRKRAGRSRRAAGRARRLEALTRPRGRYRPAPRPLSRAVARPASPRDPRNRPGAARAVPREPGAHARPKGGPRARPVGGGPGARRNLARPAPGRRDGPDRPPAPAHELIVTAPLTLTAHTPHTPH